MSAGKQCDNCQKWAGEYGALTWIHVERRIITIHETAETDFCSMQCLQEWAAAKSVPAHQEGVKQG